MKIKSILILCLLLTSTHSWSNGKWLSYGNGMVNLDNVKVITKGVTIHKEMYEDFETNLGLAMLMELNTSSVLIPPEDRCYEGINWNYRLWVNSFKIKDYLPAYSTEQIPSKDTLLSSLDGYSDITEYETFKNWYFYKHTLTEDQRKEIVSSLNMTTSEQEELFSTDNGISKGLDMINSEMNSLLPVSESDYKTWLSDESENKIIEDTYNLKDHYLSNTVPMYHNSLKFDEFELWISGTSCNLNLVSSESESSQLIQDTLSKIGNFINSDKHYMELF